MAKPTSRCVLFLLRHSCGLRAPPNAISPKTHLRAIALAPPHGNVLPPRWPAFVSTRPKTTTSSSGGYSTLGDPSPNIKKSIPRGAVFLDGCDYRHWLVIMEFPEDGNKPSEKQMIQTYVKTLATVVGSEEAAKRKIYSVCTSTYTGFGALISEELSSKLKNLPGVRWVLPDSYFDVREKDYGGDLFVKGKVIHRLQFRSARTVKAVPKKENPSIAKAVSKKEKPSTGKTVSKKKKPSTVKTVSKKEKPSTVKIVSKKEKPSTVKTVSKKEKPWTVKTVSKKEKPSNVKTVSKKKEPSIVKTVSKKKEPSTVKTVSKKKEPSTVKTASKKKKPSTVRTSSKKRQRLDRKKGAVGVSQGQG